jgi:chemotaxis protein CheZ
MKRARIARERGIKPKAATLPVELVFQAMAQPRKIFRIEQMAAARSAVRVPDEPAQSHQANHYAELMNELAALRAVITATAMQSPGKAESANAEAPATPQADRLTSELNLIVGAISGSVVRANGANLPCDAPPLTRIAYELAEVVASTEQATQKILGAAEDIDQVAKNLSAALGGKYEQGLVQDIQDVVVRIFEACNFQDLAGQRVTKVLSILNFVEDHVARVIEEIARESATVRRNGEQYLHGPRLDRDFGHVTQDEVDAMFGT